GPRAPRRRDARAGRVRRDSHRRTGPHARRRVRDRLRPVRRARLRRERPRLSRETVRRRPVSRRDGSRQAGACHGGRGRSRLPPGVAAQGRLPVAPRGARAGPLRLRARGRPGLGRGRGLLREAPRGQGSPPAAPDHDGHGSEARSRSLHPRAPLGDRQPRPREGDPAVLPRRARRDPTRRRACAAEPQSPSPPGGFARPAPVAHFVLMADASDLAQQLAAEDRTKQRQYVLSSTRGRWRILGLGAVLLSAIRLAGVVPVAWSFILGFTVLFAAVNYAMTRVARSRALPPWYTQAPIAGGAAVVRMRSRRCAGLRASRTSFGRLEAGALTARVPGGAPAELGYLGVSLSGTTDGIAGIVRQVQRQGQELATLAQQLAGSARQVQTASQGISTTTQGLTRGAERQRELIGHGRADSEAAAAVASQLHARAQDAERQIAGVAQQARRHGQEIARAS